MVVTTEEQVKGQVHEKRARSGVGGRGPAGTVRLYVRPSLRGIGSRLIPGWLAITLGHSILSWRPLDEAELAHELRHVRQWEQGRFRFPLRYLAASIRAVRSGGSWYRDNALEVEAQAAAEEVRERRSAGGRAPEVS